MDFTFTDEQRMMSRALRELLDDVCSPAAIRAAAEYVAATAAVPATEGAGAVEAVAAGQGVAADAAAARWHRLVDMGLASLLAPEASGGLGLSEVDFVSLAGEAGRVALPEMLIEHAGIAVPLLSAFASDRRAADALDQATRGAARVAVGHPLNPFAMAAHQADLFLLAHGDEVHLVARSQVQLSQRASVDPLRALATIDFTPSDNTRIASGPAARAAWAAGGERGALYAAAEMLGLTERLIAIAVEYSGTRKQFGKAIGSYQAIKHHLANAQVKLEFARPVLYAAAALLEAGTDRARLLVSHAKLAAIDASDFAARVAIQVHGAMGYSWEVDLHFYMKRAWVLAGWYGDRNFHMRRVQSSLFSEQFPIGPEFTLERTGAHG